MDINLNLKALISASLAFLIVIFTMPLASAWCKKIGLIDSAGDDPLKIHSIDIPLAGGAAIITAFLLIFVIFSLTDGGGLSFLGPVLLAALLVFFVGLADDLSARTPLFRLSGHLAAGVILFSFGVRADIFPVWYVGLPLTLFYAAGAINAMNLIDGLDGLAGGVAAISSFFLVTISVVKGDMVNAVFLASVFGAAAAFLVFNRPPARIFLGNSGAYLLGVVIAVGIIRLMEPFSWKWFIAPLAAFSVPVLDISWAVTHRVISGKPVTGGDRLHLYDCLYRRGWPVWKILLLFYLLSAAGGGIGLAAALH